jgi:hypothetical protein
LAYKFLKGVFRPKNPEKYNGSHPIIYRSGWEIKVMQCFDAHPHVVMWQSETVSIPYQNPLTGKHTVYIPDFLVKYIVNGVETVMMIEVKPWREIPGNVRVSKKTGKPLKVSAKDKASQIVNAAKWEAAQRFCAKRNWEFNVMSEDIIFAYERK